MVEFDFQGTVIEWRGPAPYHFVRLPDWVAEQVAELARAVTYGWGMIPVGARIGDTVWTTSLFAKDGGYLLPVKVATRRTEGIDEGDVVTVRMSVAG